jgi:hypothetical protein
LKNGGTLRIFPEAASSFLRSGRAVNDPTSPPKELNL